MNISFDVVLVNGEPVPDLSVFTDAISDILFEIIDEETVTIEKSGFSLYKIPTLNEILEIEQKLVALGLVIKA